MEKSQESNTIAYQDILEAKAYLLELKEWHAALHFMRHFLDEKKTRTSGEIQVCSEMFDVVYQNFDILIGATNGYLTKLVKAN